MNEMHLDVLPKAKDGSYYKDLVEDMKTIRDIARDARKWKQDNGQTSNNNNNNKGNQPPNVPPPLGRPDKDVNINVDDEAYI